MGEKFAMNLKNEQMTLQEITPEYEAFVEKFKPKKTTDDCFTPPMVWDAVAEWVEKEYGVDRSKFVDPFYPGGNYQRFFYSDDCIVVANPPFSIITEIKRFYAENGIKFFLFAPSLTLFSGFSDGITLIPVGVTITYENGANVATSFCTNLDKWQIRTAPELYKAVDDANKKNIRKDKKELPKYEYPDNVITSSMLARWCKYGIDFRLSASDCFKIPALCAQKKVKKTIFGSGFLISERAAAERAAAERAAAERAAAIKWELSPSEWAIVDSLGLKK